VVGEQIEVRFVDPVLHLLARAANRFVKMPSLGPAPTWRGHGKAWTGRTDGPLGLANDVTRAFQLSRIDQVKSRKRRGGLPLASASTRAASISAPGDRIGSGVASPTNR